MKLALEIYLCIITPSLFLYTAAASEDCKNVRTREGTRTLRHGQKACAPKGDTEDGNKFITCSFGQVYTHDCQPGLRYDTASGLCNWTEVSTCEMSDITVDRVLTLAPVNKHSSETREPTPLPQTSRPRRGCRRCNVTNCKLPSCFCFGDTPSAFPTADTPMFLMLTFDDAVTSSLYNNYYRALVVDNTHNLFNPNGCRIKSTFYVTHDNTDYSKVKAIWSAGNEIGSHTVHHRRPKEDKDTDYQLMREQVYCLLQRVNKNDFGIDEIRRLERRCLPGHTTEITTG